MNMSMTETMPGVAATAGSTGTADDINRGVAAAQAGDKLGAHRIFQSLAARNAHMPDVWVWLGGTSSNLDEAEASFQRAVMLDPSNEGANLGLRWVALRRQMTGRSNTLDFATGAIDRLNSNTDALSSSSLGTVNLNTGSLKAADADKAMKMKVGKAGSRRLPIPMAAIILFLLSIILYGIVLFFVINPH